MAEQKDSQKWETRRDRKERKERKKAMLQHVSAARQSSVLRNTHAHISQGMQLGVLLHACSPVLLVLFKCSGTRDGQTSRQVAADGLFFSLFHTQTRIHEACST